MGERVVKLDTIDFRGVPTATFQVLDPNNGNHSFALSLDELERSIHNLMRARHLMTIEKHHDECTECVVNAIAKVGE